MAINQMNLLLGWVATKDLELDGTSRALTMLQIAESKSPMQMVSPLLVAREYSDAVSETKESGEALHVAVEHSSNGFFDAMMLADGEDPNPDEGRVAFITNTSADPVGGTLSVGFHVDNIDGAYGDYRLARQRYWEAVGLDPNEATGRAYLETCIRAFSLQLLADSPFAPEPEEPIEKPGPDIREHEEPVQ